MTKARGQIKPRGVDAKGRERWAISVYLSSEVLAGHRVRHYKTETVTGSRRQAEKALTKLLSEKDDYGPTQASRELFGKYLARWLAETVKLRVRASTFASYSDTLRIYILPEVQHVRLDRVRAATCKRLVTRLVERGLGPRTVRYCAALVSSALSDARRERLITFNPMEDIPLPRQVKHELTIPDQGVRDRLLAELQRDEHWSLWCVLVTTGLRPSEALGLQWSDVDLDGALLTVRRALAQRKGVREFAPPKTARGRRSVSLPAETVAVLREHRAHQLKAKLQLGELYADGDLVFPDSRGRPLDWHRARARHFRRACTRAALTCGVCGKLLEQDATGAVLHREDPEIGHAPVPALELLTFRPYDLRHLHASLLLARHVDLATISARLGHATGGFTLSIYAHAVPGGQDEAASAIASAVFGSESGAIGSQSDSQPPLRAVIGSRK